MMVAAVVAGRQLALAVVGAAKLAAPEDQRIVKHSPLLEVLNQGRTWLVGFPALLTDAARQIAVMVPARMIKLDEPNVALRKPSR